MYMYVPQSTVKLYVYMHVLVRTVHTQVPRYAKEITISSITQIVVGRSENVSLPSRLYLERMCRT